MLSRLNHTDLANASGYIAHLPTIQSGVRTPIGFHECGHLRRAARCAWNYASVLRGATIGLRSLWLQGGYLAIIAPCKGHIA